MPDLPPGIPAPPPEGGGNGGSSGGSSSSSSSGGSSGSSSSRGNRDAIITAQMRAAYRDILRRWGLAPSKNLLNLIEKAIVGQWGSTLFIDRLRHTPEYKEKFPGIRWQDGMTEASYNAQFAQYKAKAQDVGETLTRKQFQKLVKRGVTFDEYSDRIAAIESIERWGPIWGYFTDALEAQGVAKNVQKGDLVKFVMGLSSKRWEQVYEETFITANLERVAGVTVGEAPPGWAKSDYAISRQDLVTLVRQIDGLNPGGGSLADISSQDWEKIGRELRQFSPTYLQRYGITTKDLLEMEFGGPRSAAIAGRAEKVLATQEAATSEPRATPQQAQGVGSTYAQRRELPQAQ